MPRRRRSRARRAEAARKESRDASLIWRERHVEVGDQVGGRVRSVGGGLVEDGNSTNPIDARIPWQRQRRDHGSVSVVRFKSN